MATYSIWLCDIKFAVGCASRPTTLLRNKKRENRVSNDFSSFGADRGSNLANLTTIGNNDWKYLRGCQGTSSQRKDRPFSPQHLRQVYPLREPFASDRLRLIVLPPPPPVAVYTRHNARFDFNISSILPACGNEQRKGATWKRDSGTSAQK